MSGPGVPLLRAILAALRAGSPARAAYSQVMATTKPPYFTVGPINGNDAGTKTSHDWEMSVDVHAWSDTSGTAAAEVESMLDEAVDMLHQQGLTVEGFATVGVNMASRSGAFIDPDGVTWHAVAAFRVLLAGGEF